tara:strand:+ start:225 stop:470 length:246 start_codon:yes stop_codon:yes gene_type:complete
MSITTDMIDLHHGLLEYTISPEKDEYYGRTMSVKNIQQNHTMVCTDQDCSEFKSTEDIAPGDTIYIEDETGELDVVVVNER